MTTARRLLRWYVLLVVLVFDGCVTGTSGDAEPPNVVLMIIDDLGWVDTGVYGSAFYETPNIDRLAAQGVRFTQFYTASPVCSPTRASIMTGKHPARLNLTNWIGGEQAGKLLPAEYVRRLPLAEVTVGEAFKDAGYTTGYIGKWHLGAEGYLPESQGFEYTVAVNHAGQPGSYFYPYRSANWPATDVPDLDDGIEGEYLTDRLTNEAVDFLERHRDERFLLVFSHYAVHTPLEAKADMIDKYSAKADDLPPASEPAIRSEGSEVFTKLRQDHPVYAGMVESTDESVGRILDTLEELDLASNTVVVFVSDNGGLSTLHRNQTRMPTSNMPLRAGKGWLYEGGIRAPLIVKWPEGARGGRVESHLATTTDLYPTLLDIAGLSAIPDQHLDGVSLAPLLRGEDEVDRDTLYWHFPHYHGSGNTPTGAIRAGNVKLIEWFEDDRVELYYLTDDLGERTDLAMRSGSEVVELRKRLAEWRNEVGALMPKPNPDSVLPD